MRLRFITFVLWILFKTKLKQFVFLPISYKYTSWPKITYTKKEGYVVAFYEEEKVLWLEEFDAMLEHLSFLDTDFSRFIFLIKETAHIPCSVSFVFSKHKLELFPSDIKEDDVLLEVGRYILNSFRRPK